MKWLADENLEAEYVRWLRDRRDDVLWAVETRPGADDPYWLNLAFEHKCVLITSDLDFGKLVIEARQPTAGVVLLRLHQTPPQLRLSVLAVNWAAIESHCPGYFIILTERKFRVRPIA